jgi:hypothetical protein
MLTRNGWNTCIRKTDSLVSVMLDSYTFKYCWIIFNWRRLCTNISLVNPDLKNIEREDTTKTYKEWLRVQGQLDDISNITSVTKFLLLIFLHNHIISYTSYQHFLQWNMWTVIIIQM